VTVAGLRCEADEGAAELEATAARALASAAARNEAEVRLRELRESSARLAARAGQAEEEGCRLRSLKSELEREVVSANALKLERQHELAAVRNELGTRLLKAQQEMEEAEEEWRRVAADEERQLEVVLYLLSSLTYGPHLAKHILACSSTRTRTRTRTLTHARTHARARTCTHTHARTRARTL